MAYAVLARATSARTRQLGLEVPSFRSPPRDRRSHRSVRFRAGAPPVVAVQLRDRSTTQVVTDVVDGVVMANRLTGDAAGAMRRALFDALREDLGSPEEPFQKLER